MMRRRFPALLVSLNLAFVPWAQAVADDEVFFDELPVVATVSRLPQRLADAPTAVTVIDRETLRQLPIRDLNDILRLVPGFQTYPNTTESGRVVYHGLTDEEFSPRLQVLVDGRSMYSPAFRGGVNWALIPVALEDIERVEVVRGTNAVSYGSNAFLGVVNIVTIDPSLTRGVSVGVRHGSQNVRDHSLRVGGRLGEAGDFRLTYQNQNDNGLRDQWDWVDSYKKRLLDLRADFTLSNRDTLQFSLGKVEAETQIGRYSSVKNRIPNPSDPIRPFMQDSTYLQLQWTRALHDGGEFRMRYAYAEDEADESFNRVQGDLRYLYGTKSARGSRHEIEAQHITSLGSTARVAWGGGWRRDAARSDTMLSGQGWVERDVVRSFANLEWKPAVWTTINAGLAAEHDSLAGRNLSPRLSAAYHLNDRNTVRVGASRAYRSGSIIDYRGEWWEGRKYQFRGDPSMPSERMDTLELGYLGDWQALGMVFDLRVFQEKIDGRLMQIDRHDRRVPNDLVLLPDGSSVRIRDLIPDGMLPIQDIRMYGLEYQLKWQPWAYTRVILHQAFIDTQSEFTEEAMSRPHSTLKRSDKRPNIHALAEQAAPTHATGLFVMQKLPFGFELSGAAYWQGVSKWSQNTWAQKYHRVDVKLGYHFKLPGGRKAEISCTSQSVNGEHPEYKAYGQPHDRVVERRTWLALRLDL